jgi:hypothetical protein
VICHVILLAAAGGVFSMAYDGSAFTGKDQGADHAEWWRAYINDHWTNSHIQAV